MKQFQFPPTYPIRSILIFKARPLSMDSRLFMVSLKGPKVISDFSVYTFYIVISSSMNKF